MNEKFITRISFSLSIDNCLDGSFQKSDIHTHKYNNKRFSFPLVLSHKKGKDSNPLSFIRLLHSTSVQPSHYQNPDEPLNYPFVKLSAYNNNNNVIIFPFISFFCSSLSFNISSVKRTTTSASHF